jgi:membrane-bound lytic murein transglycosylase D
MLGLLVFLFICVKGYSDSLSMQDQEIDPEDIGIVVSVVLDNSPEIIEVEKLKSKIHLNLNMDIAEKTAVKERIRILKRKGLRHITKYINRGKKYIPLIKRIFEEKGIPDELIFLPIVESKFNVKAKSPAGAAGLWQFMPQTGRTYGLKINKWIDERYDVEKSTIAAARYLKDLYSIFDDWMLAIASYNSGEGAIIRRIRMYGGKDFWDIDEYLSRETRNYVPNFLATVSIVKELLKEEHFDYETVNFDILKVNKPVSLSLISEISGIPYKTLRKMNPHLKKGKTPPHPGTYNIYLPKGYKETVETALEKIPLVNYYALKEYIVKKGDTVSSIADKFGISSGELLSINKLKPNQLRIGMVLKVPSYIEAYPEYAKGVIDLTEDIVYTSKGLIYKVKPGDTLITIAKKFHVSVKALKKWNKISKYIYPNQKLVIYKKVPLRRGNLSPINVKYLKKLLKKRKRIKSRYVYHIVQEGDSLIKIAKRYGITVRQLKKMNNLKSNKIFIGQRLKVIKFRNRS